MLEGGEGRQRAPSVGAARTPAAPPGVNNAANGEEVPAAVTNCHTAGIQVVMVTGDHPVTGGRPDRGGRHRVAEARVRWGKCI